MDCTQFRKDLAIFIDAVWEDKRPIEILSEMTTHAEKCVSCDKRLKTAMAILQLHETPIPASPFLAARISSRLQATKPASLKARWILVPILGSMLLLFGILFITTPIITTNNELMRVYFQLTLPEASEVFVVGDWNSWNTRANPLVDADGDGVWETTIKLRVGKEYRYQFHIDGSEWIADPEAPLKIHDGFGGWNSIIQL